MSKTIPLEQAVQIALEQHQLGNFARAEALYVEILRQDPGNVDAMHLLGVLANQGGQPGVAVELISRAISRRGDVPLFHYNLADALTVLGRNDEAIASYELALELDPGHMPSLANLGSVLVRAGQFTRAEEICRRALAFAPQDASLLNNLGSALRGLNILEEARSCFEKALALQPEHAEAVTNLAMTLCAQGQLGEGIARFQEAVRLRPAIADVHNNLGTALTHARRFDDAIRSFQTAIDLNPKHAEATNNLGSSLRSLGKLDQAIPWFKKAIEINPDLVEGYANLAASQADMNDNAAALESIDHAIARRANVARMHFLRGIVLRNLWQHDEGIISIRHAIELDPEVKDAYTSLGYALLEQGDLDGAMAALTRGIEGTPDATSHSNVLMTMNYHPGYTPADLLALHQRWATLHEHPLRAGHRPHTNDRSPDRKLRVGYVSPDFRGHSVAFFLEPILAHHDHAQIEVFAYAHIASVDMNTYRLRSQINHWRETASKPYEQVEQMIRDDQIDILVDLAGHTGSNLLPVFARKPAPIQINMIGFPSTTGLTSMNYRITDALCDPPGVSDAFNTESLIRMPRSFWVYQPPADCPPIGNLPADDNGIFTFTSVNNFTKVTPAVQLMWAKLLRATPNSKLIIQTSAMNSPQTKAIVQARFEAEGVSADRLDFRPWSDMKNYLALLERSDITLDPYPFNGGTTTCHSLWMGAPVLTLAGDRHASRMGLSMMTNIGLPEFVAHSPEEYVAIGQRLAGNVPWLREVRRTMRERLLASPLLDAAGHTRELEAVYRQAWTKWCSTGV